MTQPSKSDLFRRAWSLVRFNCGKLRFGSALKLAWAELKAGAVDLWFPDEEAELTARIMVLENKSHPSRADFDLIDTLRAKRLAVRAAKAARHTAPAFALAAE